MAPGCDNGLLRLIFMYRRYMRPRQKSSDCFDVSSIRPDCKPARQKYLPGRPVHAEEIAILATRDA